LHENVTILIVKIATNRSTIELVNRSIGIRDREGIVKEVHGDGEKGEMLANQVRD
jgi:uncharacterized protein affecting Mg2+/Co2+ transport